MRLNRVCVIGCILLLLAACGRKAPAYAPEGAEPDTAGLSEEAGAAAEAEIAALTDTAQQETADVLRSGEMAGAYIYVSKSKMRLYVVSKADSVLFSCGIACGIRRGNKEERGDYRTPEGRFRISGMFDSTDWIHRTKDGRAVKGCYGPYFLRIATGRWIGIGIHGTNAPRSIGKRASEGCIRVKSENIVELFNRYVYDGMPVVVAGEKDPLPPFFALPGEAPAPEPPAPDTLAVEPAPEAAADTLRHPIDTLPEPPTEGGEAAREVADTAYFQ